MVKNSELQITLSPVYAVRVVGTTATEAFADLTGRMLGGNYIKIDNTLGSSTIHCTVGASVPTSGSAGKGDIVLPGDFKEYYTSLPVKYIADTTNNNVVVQERIVVI